MTAFSAAIAFMALQSASEAIRAALHSEDLLNIRTLLAPCRRPIVMLRLIILPPASASQPLSGISPAAPAFVPARAARGEIRRVQPVCAGGRFDRDAPAARARGIRT